MYIKPLDFFSLQIHRSALTIREVCKLEFFKKSFCLQPANGKLTFSSVKMRSKHMTVRSSACSPGFQMVLKIAENAKKKKSHVQSVLLFKASNGDWITV